MTSHTRAGRSDIGTLEDHTQGDANGAVVVREQVGQVAVVRLNRPDRLNAFTEEVRAGLIQAFDECDADDDVRAVVLTGTGRAFCAGADLAAGADTFAADQADDGGFPADAGGQVALRIFRSRKPVIAAINGPAAGVGVTMTLPADIRIASDTAKFGIVFTRRGLVPEACSSWFLPRIVGIDTAAEWVLGGKTVSAQEAAERGLVREVVPASEVFERALEIANDLVSGTAPVSVALARSLLWQMLGAAGPEDAHRLESEALFSRGRSGDVKEGVDAFLEKRPPEFPDKVAATRH